MIHISDIRNISKPTWVNYAFKDRSGYMSLCHYEEVKNYIVLRDIKSHYCALIAPKQYFYLKFYYSFIDKIQKKYYTFKAKLHYNKVKHRMKQQ